MFDIILYLIISVIYKSVLYIVDNVLYDEGYGISGRLLVYESH